MKSDVGYLKDMINEISRCRGFLQGVTREVFEESELHKYAVAKAMESIGEAAAKLTPDFKEANPDVRWSRLTRTRNQLIHNYGIMDPEALWEAANSNLPKLADLLSKIVPPDNNKLGSPGSNNGPDAGKPHGGLPESTKSSGRTKSGQAPNKKPPKESHADPRVGERRKTKKSSLEKSGQGRDLNVS